MRNRIHQVKFYANNNELEIINNQIQKSGMKQSDFLRKCAMQKEIIIINDLDDITYELRKIGININQIARKMNSFTFFDCTDDLKLTQKELNNLWQLLSVIALKVQ